VCSLLKPKEILLLFFQLKELSKEEAKEKKDKKFKPYNGLIRGPTHLLSACPIVCHEKNHYDYYTQVAVEG